MKWFQNTLYGCGGAYISSTSYALLRSFTLDTYGSIGEDWTIGVETDRYFTDLAFYDTGSN